MTRLVLLILHHLNETRIERRSQGLHRLEIGRKRISDAHEVSGPTLSEKHQKAGPTVKKQDHGHSH
jgi:hypothetical protein